MKKKRKKSRRKKRVLFLLAEIVILAVLLAVGYVILKYDKFQVTSFDEGDIKVNEGANQEGYTTVGAVWRSSQRRTAGRGNTCRTASL